MPENTYNSCLVVLVFALLFFSCGPKGGYGVKKIFFDGVPNPSEERQLNSVSIDSSGFISRDSILANAKSKEIYHEPFKQKKCNACHTGFIKNESIANNKALCYTCHENLENKYQTLHGPVAIGYCTQCHSPHNSKYNALLLHKDNQLCYNCHNQDYIEETKIHKSIEDKRCLTCHNAHGGKTSDFLNTNSCFECHDNYNNNYTNIHGPVAAGLCASCHENHKSKQPHLLTITGNTLCFNCHDQEDINKNTSHTETSVQQCTDCHNPHGSQNSFLLTKKNMQ